MNMQEMDDRMVKASQSGESYLLKIKKNPGAAKSDIESLLRSYIAAKLLLSGDEISDNIIEMVRLNVSKAANIPVEQLKEMDRPGICGSAPAVLAKRVLLYVDMQKVLGITLPAKEMPAVRTIQSLTDMVLPLLTA